MNMYKKNIYGLIVIWFIISCPFFKSNGYSQNISIALPTEETDSLHNGKDWLFSGHFRIDSIFTLQEADIYMVTCVDSSDLKWGGIFDLIHDYRGIPFTVVSFYNPETADEEMINEGGVYALSLVPHNGVWTIYSQFGKDKHDEVVRSKDGRTVTVPFQFVYNQVTISHNINGRYYRH